MASPLTLLMRVPSACDFLQLMFVGSAHFRELEGVLVIFLLDVSGDSCSYCVLHLVSSLYCGVCTTETIIDQLCVAC